MKKILLALIFLAGCQGEVRQGKSVLLLDECQDGTLINYEYTEKTRLVRQCVVDNQTTWIDIKKCKECEEVRIRKSENIKFYLSGGFHELNN